MDKNSVAQPAKTYFCCILKSNYYIIHVADERLNIHVRTCTSVYMCACAHVQAMCLYVFEHVYVCLGVFNCMPTETVCVWVLTEIACLCVRAHARALS